MKFFLKNSIFKYILGATFLVIFIAITIYLSFALKFSKKTPEPTENFQKRSSLSNLNPFYIGVLETESPKHLLLKLNSLRTFLENKIQRPVKIDFSNNFKELSEKIKNKDLDLIWIDPATYCELKALYKEEIFPLVIPEGGEEGEISSVFIAKKDSNIERIFDALGQRLALGNERSSFTYFIPLSMLRDLGITLKDFSSVKLLEKDKRIVLSILLGDYEIGAISEPVAKKYLSQGLKIVKSSEKVPSFVIAGTKKISEEKENLKKFFSEDIPYEVLKSLKIEKFKLVEDRDFDYIRVLIKLFKGKDFIEYSPQTIKVAILPLYSPLTIYKRFDPLMKYLSDKTGYEFKLVIPKNFEEFMKMVMEGEVHFSYQNPYVYALLSKRNKVKALNLTIGEDCLEEEREICGGDKFRGVIIVRKDSPFRDIRELKGKKILIVSPYSAGGFLSQKIYLEKLGFNLYRDFQIIDAKRQERVIIGVYKKQGDAGFVRESALGVFKEEVDLSQIRILAYTEYLPNWTFSSVKVSPELARKVQILLKELNEERVLKALKIRGFRLVKDEDFREIKKHLH